MKDLLDLLKTQESEQMIDEMSLADFCDFDIPLAELIEMRTFIANSVGVKKYNDSVAWADGYFQSIGYVNEWSIYESAKWIDANKDKIQNSPGTLLMCVMFLNALKIYHLEKESQQEDTNESPRRSTN